MHAYKDAIRRTGGAYILYSGNTLKNIREFYEIIPGLGVFHICPSKTDDGIIELKKFILEVINHFLNRASQREKIAYRTFEIYKHIPEQGDELNELLPEPYGPNRNLISDDTFVLVGFYNKSNPAWIKKSGLYNARANTDRGSLRLGPGEAGAKYLLLHSHGETKTGQLFKITQTGPRIFSAKTLLAKGYSSKPSKEYYLVYNVKEIDDIELKNQNWDITKLEQYRQEQASTLLFSVTLSELMRTKI